MRHKSNDEKCDVSQNSYFSQRLEWSLVGCRSEFGALEFEVVALWISTQRGCAASMGTVRRFLVWSSDLTKLALIGDKADNCRL